MVKVDRLCEDAKSCLGSPYPQTGGGSTNLKAIQAGASVDCSGLLCACFAAQGESLYHGSNTIWRDGSLSEKGVLTKVSQLKKGYVVLIRKEWTDSQKSNRYYGDGIGNMSHIGLVLSTNPLTIIDASQSAGKVRTGTKLNWWNRWGKLTKVDYTEDGSSTTDGTEETKMYKVTAAEGSTVRMRSSCSTSSSVIENVPVGTYVSATTETEGWAKITYNGKTGYMMIKFLQEVSAAPSREEFDALLKRVEALEEKVKGLG